MALYDTVLQVVSDAAVELGLGVQSEVYAATDANIVLLRTLLKRVGRMLVLQRHWSHLTKEHTFTTSNGVASYDLPNDWEGMEDQTGWNRTARLPLGGPMSPQEYQFLQALGSTATLTVLFRPKDQTLLLYPTPGATTQTIAFEYRSRYWVQSSGQTSPDKDEPDTDNDTLCFEPPLLVTELKLAYRKERGYDTTTAESDASTAGELVASANIGAAPVLSLTRRSIAGGLLSDRNIPVTDYDA